MASFNHGSKNFRKSSKEAGKEEKNISKTNKKRKRKRKENYAIYIYKVLVSSKAMSIMNSFISCSITSKFINTPSPLKGKRVPLHQLALHICPFSEDAGSLPTGNWRPALFERDFAFPFTFPPFPLPDMVSRLKNSLGLFLITNNENDAYSWKRK